MEVKINRVGDGPIRFEDFADKHGLVLEINERGGGFVRTDAHWYAKFTGVEVVDGCILISLYGDGRSPEDATEDYKRKLVGKRIRIGFPHVPAGGEGIRVDCPTEWLS